MVRRDTCRESRMDADGLAQGRWLHPDMVERSHRISSRKSRQCGSVPEVPAQPAQRPAPQEPFVEITHQYYRLVARRWQRCEDAPNLLAPFRWRESEMRRDDPERA